LPVFQICGVPNVMPKENGAVSVLMHVIILKINWIYMELIDQNSILSAGAIKSPKIAKMLMSVLRLNKVNDIYRSNHAPDPVSFLSNIIDELGLKYSIPESDLKNIPKTGPFIIVCNHPFGVIDGILLLYTLLQHRPDFRVMANFMLQRIKPLDDYFFSVNPFEAGEKNSSSYKGLKTALLHLKKGMPLGVFPAGEVSSFNRDFPGRTDKKWSESVQKLIFNAEVPVIPLYFKGSNSWLFHLLGVINPMLRTAKLPSEALNKKNKPVQIRLGSPIPVREQKGFDGYKDFGRHLRSMVYALGTTIEPQNLFLPVWKKTNSVEPIAKPQDKIQLSSEICKLEKSGYKLFSINFCEVYCAPTLFLDSVLLEIGRLREQTYREVGEGTNRSLDVDEYDPYYHQLFIWDTANCQIIGGYRIGFGKEIQYMFGRSGFYTNSLFQYHNGFKPVLEQGLELGRSFVVKEFQRKSMPLFMLWKGILYTLLKNPKYRYLFGTVSISDDYSKASKKLIVDFVESNYFDKANAEFVKPRNKVRFRKSDQNLDAIVERSAGSIERLDKAIKVLESNNLSIPVLLKKYLELNGKIIGFNVDPAFNNCIDGLLLVDLFDVPVSIIQSFSKEIKDNELLNGLLNRQDIQSMVGTEKSPSRVG